MILVHLFLKLFTILISDKIRHNKMIIFTIIVLASSYAREILQKQMATQIAVVPKQHEYNAFHLMFLACIGFITFHL